MGTLRSRSRLEREICIYTGRVLVYRMHATPQQRRLYTIALRGLRRRVNALAELWGARGGDR